MFSPGAIYLSCREWAQSVFRLRGNEKGQALQQQALETLLDVLDTTTSSLDLRQVARSLVSQLAAVVPAVRCSILYVNEPMTRCQVLASHDDPSVASLELDLGKYPEIRQAVQQRNALLLQDVSSEPIMAEARRHMSALGFQSIIVIPLTSGQELLGTLCLKSARAHQFSQQEIKFMTAVGRASANALKNAVLHKRLLEESERSRSALGKLASILEHSPELILTTDTHGMITEFNRGAEQLLGFRKLELIGRSFSILLDDGEAVGLMERIHLEGVIRNYPCRLKKKGGGQLDTEVSLSILRNQDGNETGSVWVGRDVTELRTVQTQLLQADKLTSLGKVIAEVAHELTNPLSGVLGYSQLAISRHPQNPALREFEKIYDSALRCHKIVRNLLSFARAQKPERKYLGLNGIIEKTLNLKEHDLHVSGIEVVRELDSQLPRTLLDFHQMQQVFLNIFNNAQQAITAVDKRPGRLQIRTSRANGMIRAEVSDNGVGMDPATLQRVFDPFFTTKRPGEGTGLGLSVSYGIVKAHGGRLHARSQKGEGSTLVVELPIHSVFEETDPGVAEGAQINIARSATAKCILVVDDEPVVLDLMIDLLEDMGHRVDTAADGREAYGKIRSCNYDLVITDVRMPGMDGLELYRSVVSLRPELEGRIIFVTGATSDSQTAEFISAVGAPALAKPLSVPNVAATVEEVLRTCSVGRTNRGEPGPPSGTTLATGA